MYYINNITRYLLFVKFYYLFILSASSFDVAYIAYIVGIEIVVPITKIKQPNPMTSSYIGDAGFNILSSVVINNITD